VAALDAILASSRDAMGPAGRSYAETQGWIDEANNARKRAIQVRSRRRSLRIVAAVLLLACCGYVGQRQFGLRMSAQTAGEPIRATLANFEASEDAWLRAASTKALRETEALCGAWWRWTSDAGSFERSIRQPFDSLLEESRSNQAKANAILGTVTADQCKDEDKLGCLPRVWLQDVAGLEITPASREKVTLAMVATDPNRLLLARAGSLGLRAINAGDSAPQIWTHAATGMDLVAIDAGSFPMGSREGAADEQPVHTVRITHPFWIGKTEVTQAQYEVLVRRNPSWFASGTDADRQPVESVSWNDAVAFCQSMSASTVDIHGVKYGFRLPTEAEWEYCCRAGTTTKWHTGDELTAAQANFAASNLSKTAPVGSYGANAWGLFDMHGNVWEWCLDAWDRSANYPSSAVSDPYVISGPYRVFRGGSWNYAADCCRSAFRLYNGPGSAGFNLGFRVVLAPVLVK